MGVCTRGQVYLDVEDAGGPGPVAERPFTQPCAVRPITMGRTDADVYDLVLRGHRVLPQYKHQACVQFNVGGMQRQPFHYVDIAALCDRL